MSLTEGLAYVEASKTWLGTFSETVLLLLFGPGTLCFAVLRCEGLVKCSDALKMLCRSLRAI